MLTSNQKGAIAEAAIVRAALSVDYDVYRPVFEGGRYDMIFDTGERLLRVQCKWAPRRGDVLVIRTYSSRRTATGLLRKPYVVGEFDALGAYSPDLDRCFLIPYEAIDGGTQVHLRIAPARNNQRLRVRLASDFAFGATLAQTSRGPIAQLGERQSGRL